MKPFLFSVVSLAGLSVISAAAELTLVATFPGQQVTGVAASPTQGRVFVNFPYWSPSHTISVAEVGQGGRALPYPDAVWNAKEGDEAKRFVCVQSVVIDKQDHLWVLDAGSPLQQGVVKGGPKLVEIDLKTNAVVRTILFSDEVAPKKSYLNDVRFDAERNYAYITESGIGSLVVVDLKTGTARRFLAGHPSTKAEVGRVIVVGDIKPVDPETNVPPQFHADGIALDAKGGWLYFHALTADTLYRIRTEALTRSEATEEAVRSKVEKVATTPAPDGMLEDGRGGVYLAAFEKNAVLRFDPATGKSTTVIEDERLQWPDTLSAGPDGGIYVTTSQIHRTAKYNYGQEKLKGPYALYRFQPAP